MIRNRLSVGATRKRFVPVTQRPTVAIVAQTTSDCEQQQRLVTNIFV